MKTSLTALAAFLVLLTFQALADEQPGSFEDKPLTETHWDKVLLAKKRLDAAMNIDKMIKIEVRFAKARRELLAAKGLLGKKLTDDQKKEINDQMDQFAESIVENKTPEGRGAMEPFPSRLE